MSNIIYLSKHNQKKSQQNKPAGLQVLDADILGYLTTERTTGDVRAHFFLSTASKRLNELLRARKVTMRKDDSDRRKNYWKAV